ncbi:hypothetical protein Tco_0750911 [Tanacetum coccineum]|uniref:Uncharacterized protein n=1 Tax=Tanacetum coccineum TaxID=301880 RepID=A0ABQ4Z5F9_9ASTR
MAMNNLYQPWRAILSMINQCLTCKTFGYDRPRYPVLQMLWGIITSTNVDYAKLMWEEFVQAIQTSLTDKANLGSPTKKDRKDKPHVIPYCRFTKLIICHLGRIHNLHQRSESPLHLAEEDLRIASYYNDTKMVTKHDQKIAAEKGGKKKPVTAKQLKPKSAKEKSSKPAPTPKPKTPLQLIDEDEPTQPELEPDTEYPGKRDEYDVERAIHISLELFQAQSQAHVGGVAIREPVAEATRPLHVVEGKGKAIAIEEQAAQSLLALHTPKRRIRDSSSHADAETGAGTDKTNTGGDTEILLIGEEQDPGKTPESQPPPDDDKMDEDQAGPDPREIRVVLAGPNPEPSHDEFMANVYPNVHESLKFPTDEHVILEDPLSSTGTLSSMKNLDDAYIIGDQFLNEKSTEDESKKLNVEAEVVSMVTVLIYQASSSVPPLSTPVIDLSSPKLVSSTTQAPIFTATTMTTTTTLPLPPPPQQQSTTDSELVACVTTLEKKFSDLEQKNKNLDNTTRNLGSRVFTLELRDLPHKIDETVREAVKEVVHVALQAPLRDHFRELPEADMKEILHQQMFESGTYKSLHEHVALYEALEAPMEQENRGEFLVEKDKSLEDVPMLDTTHISDLEDTDSTHLPKIKPRPEWLKPIPEEDRPATPEPDWVIPPNELPEPKNSWANELTNSFKDPEENKLLQKTGDMGSFITWFCKRIGKKKLSKSDLEGPAFKVAKAFHENNISLQFQMEECHRMLKDQVDLVNPEGHRLVPDLSKPWPLGGPPSQVNIQSQYFFNKDLEYLVLGDKGRRSALSISKLKVAQYLDFGLEELVPSLWIESEREYDISDAYGISYWWFKHKEFYITRYSAPSDRIKVRSYMRILNVVSLKTLERYGYTYLKEIVLRRANYKEYKISEGDFKNLHPNDFEDLYLLHLQGQLNHLSGDDKVHLFNAVNLWIRNIVIRKRVEDLQLRIEKDYTIVSKPREIIYRDNDQRKMMRETEVHKFSDGTLNRILDKLDHIVKEFKLYKYNPGMETRIWSEDDRRRSKDFMKVIERRLKIRRIFRSLKSFV